MGCDSWLRRLPLAVTYFNPRTPVGCDSSFSNHSRCVSRISIHAPQWGATRTTADSASCRGDFNPRTPVGCDEQCEDLFHGLGISIHAPQWGATVLAMSWNAGLGFQSTHPSGVRLPFSMLSLRPMNFNPRTPVGCDRIHVCARPELQISIHAPQWGATAADTAYQNTLRSFQSTHPSGVRPVGLSPRRPVS